MGDIAPWMDFDCILETAERHDDWSIVLFGTWKRDESPPDIPNIHCPGRVPYEVLPYYARFFDVGTIPFKLTELTRVVNPLKLYEYFAMGTPVLATSIPDVAHHEDLVYIAGSPAEFAALAEKAAREPVESSARTRRVEIARKNSWDIRGETIKNLLSVLLKERL
jgi:glycosyltransferase involved in cell wall biosynthesis